MALYVFVFLLVVCLHLLLARLGRLDWFLVAHARRQAR